MWQTEQIDDARLNTRSSSRATEKGGMAYRDLAGGDNRVLRASSCRTITDSQRSLMLALFSRAASSESGDDGGHWFMATQPRSDLLR